MADKQLKTERLQMVISPQELDAIDYWRSKQPDLPSRSEAIRRLVKQGLALASGYYLPIYPSIEEKDGEPTFRFYTEQTHD